VDNERIKSRNDDNSLPPSLPPSLPHLQVGRLHGKGGDVGASFLKRHALHRVWHAATLREEGREAGTKGGKASKCVCG